MFINPAHLIEAAIGRHVGNKVVGQADKIIGVRIIQQVTQARDALQIGHVGHQIAQVFAHLLRRTVHDIGFLAGDLLLEMLYLGLGKQVAADRQQNAGRQKNDQKNLKRVFSVLLQHLIAPRPSLCGSTQPIFLTWWCLLKTNFSQHQYMNL